MTATLKLDAGPRFPVGSTVQVYPISAFTGDAGPVAGPVLSATVDADSTVTFTNLDYGTSYWMAQFTPGFPTGTWARAQFSTPARKALVTGSRGGNEALASLLAVLEAQGLISDGTEA